MTRPERSISQNFGTVAGKIIERSSRNSENLPARALTFDADAYRRFVKDAELTQAQENELLGALWELVVAFIDFGFGIHPIQQVIDPATTLESDSPSVVALEEYSNGIEHEERGAALPTAAQRINS